ncbi:SIS domain-containing protein [Halobacillus sp. A1]|uniref:sugar isomerase domain-containing protein n=1 Tax=Halobacillus sp. A1 TaxID=2880262 RepID=UPI0020A6C4A7|nr:SIS domain-containing protein [Halobacillus sp. A1]
MESLSYLSKAAAHISQLEQTTNDQLTAISQTIAKRLKSSGIIHLFGCGHSSLLAQEPYYRAGGLVPVRPLIIEPLTLSQGAVQSSEYEKTDHFVHDYLTKEDIRKEDVLIVISTSGRNPAPIDTAAYARECGAYVIGLLSAQYAATQPSRHQSGKRLEDVVDTVIDTQIPVGDAAITEEGISEAFAPLSSVVGTALIHDLLAKTIVGLKEMGEDPPIFRSGNVDGADEHNRKLVKRYRDRIEF